MDPISLIVTSIVAGAVAASKDVSGQAVKDAYNGFKALLQRKFGQESDLADAITKFESRPDSEGRKVILQEEIERAKADQDADVIGAARKMFELLQSQGHVNGSSYTATLSGSGAIAQGSGAVAAGAGGVAIGGSVSGSTIVPGDHNQIDRSSRVFDQRDQNIQGSQTNIAGDANVAGDFVGRDKVTYSGNVPSNISSKETELLFAKLILNVANSANNQVVAVQTVNALKDEVSKGSLAEDKKLARLIETLIANAPSSANLVISMFTLPMLSSVTGSATQYVLEKYQA